jgi:hypothetical protein
MHQSSKGVSMKLNWIIGTALVVFGCGDTTAKSGNAVTNNGSATNNNTTNNGQTAYDPGLALDTPSNALSDEERARICSELGALTDELGLSDSDCIFAAYGAAEVTESMDTEVLRQACTESFDRCLMQSLGRPAGGNFCSPASNCSGTVEQGIACIIDAAQGQIMATSPLPKCDELTFDSLGQILQIQLPPSPPCAQFNATCD